MTKKFIQDVIKNSSREPAQQLKIKTDILQSNAAKDLGKPTIGFASINDTSAKIEQNPFFKEKSEFINKENEQFKQKRGGGLKKLFKWLLILAITSLIFFGAIKVISVLSTVNIKITLKRETLDIKKDLTASVQEKAGAIYFQTAELPPHEDIKSIAGSGTEDLKQKAEGTVVLFNSNSKSQFLVKETRLESPDGKTYKTEKSLTIPANGSVEINVFSDQPGKEYNIGLTDFKLPGFKGSSKYETIFGRSKTSMSGGYVGQASTLSEEDFTKAQEELRKEIAQDLQDSIEKNTPAGFLSYPGGIKIEFASSTKNPRVGDLNKNFDIKESATAKVYLLRKSDLEEKMIEAYASQLKPANPQGFKISDLDKLDFTLKSAAEDDSSIEFSVKGPVIFIRNTAKDNLISELRDTSSSNYKNTLSKHKEIENAEIIFSPSWWRLIPKEETRINYEEK